MEDLALQLQQRDTKAGNEEAEMRLLKKEMTLMVQHGLLALDKADIWAALLL